MNPEIAYQKIMFKIAHLRGRSVFSEFTTTIEKDQFGAYLKRNNLHDGGARSILVWRVQNTIERFMYDENEYDDVDIIVSSTVKLWNEKESYQLHNDAVEEYLMKLFKSQHARKAFNELNEGDMDNYKLYVKQGNVFMEYLLRTLISDDYLRSNRGLLGQVIQNVYQHYFDDDVEKELVKTLKNLRLYKEPAPESALAKVIEGKIDIGRTHRIAEAVSQQELPFIKGFEKIFAEVLQQNTGLPPKVANYLQCFIEHTSPNKKTDKLHNQQAQVQEAAIAVQSPVAVAEPVSAPVEPVAQHEFVQSIDAIIEQLQAIKTQTPAPAVQDSELAQQIAQYEARLIVAEDEINRLRQSVDKEREAAHKIGEQQTRKLMDAIAGSRINYLLSDLYRESIGESVHPREIIQGQLMNLFNQLSLEMGIDVHSNGYDIGDEFELTRYDLAHNYRTLRDIQETGDAIGVKLLQYGWTLNGQVIVQPLVAEQLGGN